ncbi:MAG: alpha/beta hydrolase [Chloroflexi bacterium]|nr:alpha/beta hydrolase [Chloroflexota bacterium]
MQTIRSKDGTPIAFEVSGSGPPLVLVHGTGGDHTGWRPILPALTDHFTVYTVDRRGRGGSGDAPEYNVEREFEDVAALVDSIGAPADLLGTSYGALCSLEAALRTSHVRRLVLFEPPMQTGVKSIYPPREVAEIQALLAAGKREAALELFSRKIIEALPEEFERGRADPSWPVRVANAHLILREMKSVNEYLFNAERVAKVTTPTLLMMGGDTALFLATGIRLLKQALPNNQVVELPGLRHSAMGIAPELFVREVKAFLLKP